MPGRKKTPLEKAKVTGRTKKNPARFKDSKSHPVVGVGPAPDYFEGAQIEAWYRAATAWPWLSPADAPLLEGFAQMYARMRDPEVEKNSSFFAQYRAYCSSMGGTPTDISKLTAAQLAKAAAGEVDDDANQVPDDTPKPTGADRFFH